MQKLDAVNIMLTAIGETKVNSLNSGVEDASLAESILDDTTREVLSNGWKENTYTLNPSPENVTGAIHALDEWLMVLPVDDNVDVRYDPQDKRRKLYDISGATFSFESSKEVVVYLNIPFEGLSPRMSNYITSKAARIFQETSMGSLSLDHFVRRREAEAFNALVSLEVDSLNLNVFDSPDFRRLRQ